MENKNVVLFSVLFLIIGIFIGSFIYPNKKSNYDIGDEMHMMSDGQMMRNSGMMDMDDAMGSMMMGLQGKTGDAFDQAFLSEMIMHHEGAVVMAEAVLETSKRPELLKLANDIILAQTKEIEMMKEWQKKWFNQ